jgi:hypothetical protein|tara:strand:- start:941 stop:1354 length:414 start_codon:yes stop_codon:yes gene_type:complete
MQYINGTIGCAFAVFALMHVTHPHWLYWVAVYSIGAILALTSLRNEISLGISRFLAIVTTMAMFFYFAAFFKMAPQLSQGWYQNTSTMTALGMLVGAFAMIPVLSDYSCRLKADCREELAHRKHPAFFSAPQEAESR